MHDVTVIEDPAAAEASLDPIRGRLLAELAVPGSASTLAARVGLTRQKCNYHLRALERHGLVELVEERRKGNCTERVFQATAASYVISPTALSAVAPDPSREPDQRSARWLLAVAGRLVREVGELITAASGAGKPLATLGIDSEVRSRPPPTAPRSPPSSPPPSTASSRSTTTSQRPEVVRTASSSRCIPPSPTRGAQVMSRPFEVTREIDLPAAADDVWTAITADPAAWMFPTGIEIPAGDAPPEEAPVTTWDPPQHLVIRMQSPDGTFNALEYAIEARDGGTAHLRYVHSGILADGWEDQYDAIGGHTDFYLHTLGQYLEHFNGRPVTYVGQPSSGIDGPEGAGTPDAMDALRAALGVSPDAAAGDAVHARSATPARSRASSTTRRRSSSASAPPMACTASSGATTTATSSG